MYYIYKFTSPSGKSYIGQTKNLKSRFNGHKRNYPKVKSKFYDACKKYGFENFTFEILCEVETKVEVDSCEIFYISWFNTFGDNGYNMTKGGDGVQLFGPANGMFGRTHSKEVKEKLREWGRKKTGSLNPWHKTNRTEEELQNRANAAAQSRKMNLSELSDEERDAIKIKNSEDKNDYYESEAGKVTKKKIGESVSRFYKNLSLEEKKEINAKKSLKGESNGRAAFYKLISPLGDEFLVSMRTGLNEFCDLHNLDSNRLYTFKNLDMPVPSEVKASNTKYNSDKTYKYKYDNTIGWRCQQMRRIKIWN